MSEADIVKEVERKVRIYKPQLRRMADDYARAKFLRIRNDRLAELVNHIEMRTIRKLRQKQGHQ